MNRLAVYAVVLGVVAMISSPGLSVAAPRPTGAWYTVMPTPVPYGTVYTAYGTGFKPATWTVVAQERHCEGMVAVFRETVWAGYTDTTGSFSYYRRTENCKGTYIQTASQGRRGASTQFTFTVN